MTVPTVWFGPFSSINNQGLPNGFGQLYSYAAGTSTPQATYQDANLTVLNQNPITLNALGQAFVFLTSGQAYKFVCFDSLGNQLWSEDNVIGGISSAAVVALIDSTVTESFIGALIYAQTSTETGKGITANTAYPLGTFYRYGAKGGAARTADGVSSGTTMTSASAGFAGAVAGMVAVVVDGGTLRTGGRPAPLITTIASVQSSSQITLSAAPAAPASLSCTGTLNSTTTVSSLSINPITSGVGLTRTWTVSGTNIPTSTTIVSTSSSGLVLSAAATASGAGAALTLTAPFEVCFGYDDSTAITNALSLPFPITDVKDNFLVTQPLTVGGSGCNDVAMPSVLLISAQSSNTYSALSASGYDRGGTNYLVGIRYLPFTVTLGEIECCNSGLDGLSLGPSMYSVLRMRVTNPYRNALGEFFLTAGTWQEGNNVDINCGRVGLHFHHKVTKSNSSYQNLGNYRILGRSPGLNSVYLGINAGTQPDQCGGGVRMYTSGVTVADGGMEENSWGGAIGTCEYDGERTIAQSFGSDICNSPITFVDATASYVIEGAATGYASNKYYQHTFMQQTIEDITQSSDTRSGYQFYAMTNTLVTSLTVLATAVGPWGQIYANSGIVLGTDNLVRVNQRMSYGGGLLLVSDNATSPAQQKVGYLGLPQNVQTTNYTLVASDKSKAVTTNAGAMTIPANVFAAGDTVTIVAFGGACTIAAGTGLTLYWYNGTTLTTGGRTVANGGVANVLFQSATTALVYGAGIT